MTLSNAMKFRTEILDAFYLDAAGNVRHLNNNIRGKFKQHELVKSHTVAEGYERMYIPKAKRYALKSHIVFILNGYTIPAGMQLDHKNGDILDNSINNLRLVSQAINNRNCKKRKDNSTGVTGICWLASKNRYLVQRSVNGKRVRKLKRTLSEAELALKELTALDGNYTIRHGT